MLSNDDEAFLHLAYEQARSGRNEGGIPIGSVLAIDGESVGAGHNQRVQQASPILHAEIAALDNAGRLSAAQYRKSTIYTTLSPCHMCTGAILLYGIPRVVIGENKTFQGAEELLQSHGVEVVVAESAECIELMETFIADEPSLWFEDIGVVDENPKM